MPELIFDDYKPMAISLAGKYRDIGLEFDELMSEAYLVFTRCQGSYDGVRPFAPFFYGILHNRYKSLGHKNLKMHSTIGYIPGPEMDVAFNDGQNFQSRIEFRLTLEHLSNDAKCIINIVWHAPADLYDRIMHHEPLPCISLRVITDYLVRVAGWTWSRVRRTFKGIKVELR